MTEKYEFIDGEKANFPISRMCAWLEVSTSGFHDWRTRPTSATIERREELKLVIRHAFEESDGTYGYRRVHAALTRMDVAVGPELVRALMRELDLVPCQPRPWRRTTLPGQDGSEIPDLVKRDFTAVEPGRKFVGDITYIHTWEGFVFLATVIDCHTKMVVGWSMADHMRTSLIADAIDMAAGNVTFRKDCIFHSDRGSQYTSAEFQKKLKVMQIRASTGRTGVCWDNAAAESFFGALKNELVYRTTFPTREHARKAIARYVEVFYNRKRLHSAIDYKTPIEALVEYEKAQIAA
jgi:transposase InsO family protein